MRFTKYLSLSALVLLSLPILAGRGDLQQNEDLQWIKQWTRDQKAAELAQLLALDADQVATLREIKARVEAVNTEFEPRLESLQTEVAATALEVRARIEATGIFSDADKALLKDLKTQRKNLTKERRLSLEMAAIGLDEVLTEDQVAQLRALTQQRGDRGEANGQERQGNRRDGERGDRRNARGAKKVARLLLSDAFLAAYD